jgi:hypothetical protein
MTLGFAGRIRFFLLVEGASFLVASLIHAGWLISGYEHAKARIAEGIIAIVLLIGVGLSWKGADSVRRVGVAAQGFALLGTLIGLFTVAVGVGPRTTPDNIYHIVILLVLVSGLCLAMKDQRADRSI